MLIHVLHSIYNCAVHVLASVYFSYNFRLGDKNMKNLKLLAAAVAVVLAGCAQTPDSVRFSAEKDSKERNEITAIQYISSNKLSDDIDNALDKSYTQFDLRENISVELPEDYCEVDFTQISDYEENYEKIMTRIFGKDVLDRENTVHDETGDGMVSYSFSDDDEKMYGCVGNNGFICFAKPSAFDDLFNGGNRVKIYCRFVNHIGHYY